MNPTKLTKSRNPQQGGAALLKYDAARKALQVAHSVDEVRDIKDKAEAVRAYARQAGDTEMQNWAVEIKLRAERRAGELLAEMKEAGILAKLGEVGGRGSNTEPSGKLTLEKSLGVQKKQADTWRKAAKVPEEKFEAAIATAKETGELTGAAVRRALGASEWWEEHWKGMPEFVQNDETPFRTLYVHFANQADVDVFAKLIGQEISDKAKYIWYPKGDLHQFQGKQYVSEDGLGVNPRWSSQLIRKGGAHRKARRHSPQ